MCLSLIDEVNRQAAAAQLETGQKDDMAKPAETRSAPQPDNETTSAAVCDIL